MKKYIAPNAKFICLNTEKETLSLISSSLQTEGTADGNDAMSNERTPSSFIWGDED